MCRVAFLAGFALIQAVAALTGGRLVCKLIGHDPSWWLGVSYGFDRPVCHRCSKVL
jgi:hypothetical protein